MTELGRFEDDRGVIQDLLAEPIDSVTAIYSKSGAVRGNHTHNETVQWTYVVSGRMRVKTRLEDGCRDEFVLGAGDLHCDLPGIAHAWEALGDTLVLVFTRGPRSGASYEDDVQRLAPEDRLI